jgi:hypothetical protein
MELPSDVPESCGVNKADDRAVDAVKKRKKRTAVTQNRDFKAFPMHPLGCERNCGTTRLLKILFPALVVRTPSLLNGINRPVNLSR